MEKPRILVVDDERVVQDMLSRHLRFLGYEVSKAGDGLEALEIMTRRNFDVVISDIKMPKMDGIKLLGEIRKHHPMTQCIMITGYATREHVLACMNQGAYTCVYKPLEDIKELEMAVQWAINHPNHWLVN